MQNIVLVIHLILALCLIGAVLLQRSEGGGLGIGGGGGGTGGGRPAMGAMSKLTWVFAICFVATSITLTIMAASDASSDSVIERLGETPTGDDPLLPPSLEGDLLPPTIDDAPATPPTPVE